MRGLICSLVLRLYPSLVRGHSHEVSQRSAFGSTYATSGPTQSWSESVSLDHCLLDCLANRIRNHTPRRMKQREELTTARAPCADYQPAQALHRPACQSCHQTISGKSFSHKCMPFRTRNRHGQYTDRVSIGRAVNNGFAFIVILCIRKITELIKLRRCGRRPGSSATMTGPTGE